MDSKETLDAELEMLRVELRELDQKRREEELELKSFEKELKQCAKIALKKAMLNKECLLMIVFCVEGIHSLPMDIDGVV